MGARKSAELREGIKRERLAFSDLFQPPHGLNRDHARQKNASKLKVDALLRKLGASRSKLARISRDFDRKLEEIVTPADGKVFPGFNLDPLSVPSHCATRAR